MDFFLFLVTFPDILVKLILAAFFDQNETLLIQIILFKYVFLSQNDSGQNMRPMLKSNDFVAEKPQKWLKNLKF